MPDQLHGGLGPTAAEKIQNAETMWGTGSKQHLAAKAKFGKAAARDFAQANLKLDMAGLRTALDAAYGDAYVTGLLVSAQQTGVGMVAGLGETLIPTDAAGWGTFWDSWAPGNIGASDLLSDGGLADLLAQTDTTISGIEGTTLDRLGNLLADGVASGDSVDAIAASMGDLIDDPDRASLIANTETARAVSNASMDGYATAGIEQVDWLVSPGACQECLDYFTGSPYLLGDAPAQPAHPGCRCSLSPRDPGVAPADEESADG
jgi:hypothetical protein